MTWKVYTPNAARADIGRLPTERLVDEVIAIIDDLAEDPFAPDALQMRAYKNRYRIRFGDEAYRLVYEVNRKRRTVTIIRVRLRPTAYRGMRNS